MELPQEDTAALAAISGGWEWGSLLDFPIDDDSGLLSWGSSPLENQRSGTDTSFSPSDLGAPAADRVRKRDPRLVCPNFMAGRVPCACPEVDEAAAMNVRKRTKTAVRCQVPDCEVDISELKGYHRRHRVCLRCAYAPTVVLDGQMHRYCQQCGKFHLLPDFDEGKRSCRRKLERHNHRRRRKSLDCKSMPETSQTMERRKSDMCLVDAPSGVEEAGKGKILRESCGDDSVHINEQEMDRNHMLETEDVLGSPVSAVAIQVNNCTLDVPNEAIPSTTSSGVVKESIREHSISEMSSSFYENKTAYSSMCPTGRVSFKLYDWNPAEFPRRLRHQIFHWLANMPVELEGYIRPGCTILTAFIAMPQKMRKRIIKEFFHLAYNFEQALNTLSSFTWRTWKYPPPLHSSFWNSLSPCIDICDTFIICVQLAEGDPALANDLINAPESMLAGRGNMLIYLHDSIFQFLKGENSLKRIMPRIKAPRLHYAYPICFEAGKPMEFIVCGENLVQSRFRFLVSFDGRYLQCEHCQVIPIVEARSDSETNVNDGNKRYHEMLKVHISHTEPKTYGPAFIEVENKSGLSNFIPVIFADPQMCSDFEMVQKVLCEFAPRQGNGPHLGNYDAFRDSYAFSGEKHEIISELLLDIAWLISEPKKDERHTMFHVQRLNGLLDFLIRNEIVNILKKILKLPKVLMLLEKVQNLRDTEANVDLDTFHLYIKSARELIAHVTGVAEGDSLPLDLDDRTHENSEVFVPKYIFQAVECSGEQNFSQETPTRENNCDIVSTRPETASSLTEPGDQQTPLLVKDFVMKVHGYSHEAEGLDSAMQRQSRYLSSTYLRTRRPLVMMVAAIAFCCGLCIILRHPHKVLEFSHAVRKCLLCVH